MKVKSITYPTELDNGINIEDDNIDVFVELEDGRTYCVVVATYKNIATQMENSNKDYLEGGAPQIIVKKLTHEIIEQAINSHAEDDAYWIKIYGLSHGDGDGILHALLNKLDYKASEDNDMTKVIIERIEELLIAVHDEKEQCGFDIQLRNYGTFDKGKLELVTEELNKYKANSNSNLIEKKFMELFFEFHHVTQCSIGYNDDEKLNTPYQLEVNKSVEEVVSLVKSMISEHKCCAITTRIKTLLWGKRGYLTRLQGGKGVFVHKIETILELLDDYEEKYSESDMVEKEFLNIFIDFMTISYGSKKLYDEDMQIEIEDLADDIMNKIYSIVSE